MDVFLIRHAHAGSRTGSSHDIYRQLSDEGWAQAARLQEFFTPLTVSAIYSSPATRCSQTVEPLAEMADLPVIEHDDLWEDALFDDVFAVLMDACANVNESGSVVACTHGNLIPAIVERVAVGGVPVSGRGCERASIWRLRRSDGHWVEARYLTPRTGYQY